MSATRIPNQSQHANAGDVTSTRESNTIEWNNSENFEILRDNSNNHHLDQVKTTLENVDTQQSDSVSNRGITDLVMHESQSQSQNQVRFQNQTTEIIIRDNQNTNQNQQSRLDSTRATQTLSC